VNLKTAGILLAFVGVAITSFAGTAIARRAGFDAESWLIGMFALGIFLLSQGPVLRLLIDGVSVIDILSPSNAGSVRSGQV